MPSWTATDLPQDEEATPPETAATKVERARRLLQELFARRPSHGRALAEAVAVPSGVQPSYPFRMPELPDRVLFGASACSILDASLR